MNYPGWTRSAGAQFWNDFAQEEATIATWIRAAGVDLKRAAPQRVHTPQVEDI